MDEMDTMDAMDEMDATDREGANGRYGRAVAWRQGSYQVSSFLTGNTIPFTMDASSL